jgi:hypothetical protein
MNTIDIEQNIIEPKVDRFDFYYRKNIKSYFYEKKQN